MMCMDNSLTERKSKSKTSAAVANRIAPGKEHFKNTILQIIRNTGTVIAATYFSGSAVIRMCEPTGVYLTALFTRLMSTCMMSPASIRASNSTSPQSTAM